MRSSKKLKGFTLIEIMVVMAIIAILAVLIIGAIQLARNTATETTHRANAKTIQAGLEAGYARTKAYCGTTGTPTCGAQSFETARIALGVAMGTTSECTLTRAGGGRITVLTGSTYTIVPGNAACGACTDTTDVLTIGGTQVCTNY